MNDSALLELFAELDSTAVSDALDQLDLPAGIGGIRPLWGASRIVGFAVTVALEPHDGRQAGALATMAIESAEVGSVIVVDNQGRTDVSCWGGILSVGAAERGVRGVAHVSPSGAGRSGRFRPRPNRLLDRPGKDTNQVGVPRDGAVYRVCRDVEPQARESRPNASAAR